MPSLPELVARICHRLSGRSGRRGHRKILPAFRQRGPLVLESLEIRNLLTGEPSPLHNQALDFDVNNDGFQNASDVFAVISLVRADDDNSIEVHEGDDLLTEERADTTNEWWIDSADVHATINFVTASTLTEVGISLPGPGGSGGSGGTTSGLPTVWVVGLSDGAEGGTSGVVEIGRDGSTSAALDVYFELSGLAVLGDDYTTS